MPLVDRKQSIFIKTAPKSFGQYSFSDFLSKTTLFRCLTDLSAKKSLKIDHKNYENKYFSHLQNFSYLKISW